MESKQESEFSRFQLIQYYRKCHDKAIRSIGLLNPTTFLTGGKDGRLQSHVIDSKLQLATNWQQEQSDWIAAIQVLTHARFAFAIGCADGNIQLFDSNLARLMTLQGHLAPVASLSCTGQYLYSGSWDETVRCWDLNTGACVKTLSGHENNTCVLCLPNGYVVSGSCGFVCDGQLVGQQIRLWKDVEVIKCMTDHTAGIRDFELFDTTFASAANDGTIRFWSFLGEFQKMITIPEEPLIFSIKRGVLPHQCISLDTSDQICIWNIETLSMQQRIVLSACCVLPLTGQALVVGCSDGCIRIYSQEHSSMLEMSEDIRNCACVPKSAQYQYPLLSEQEMYKGTMDQQISIFQDEIYAMPIACRWNEADHQWKALGAVHLPIKKRRKIIIDIEIDSASKGMLYLQLECYQDDNPELVAKKFCQLHELPSEYVTQIELYIRSHMRS